MVTPPDRSSLGRQGLGLRLREIRQGANLSLSEAATRSGLSLSYLSDLERGRRLPSLEVLDAIGYAHGMLPMELLRGVYPWGATTAPEGLTPPPDGRRNTLDGPS